MVKYRRAKKEEIEILTRVSADAFFEYPLFRIIIPYLRKKEYYESFLKSIHNLVVKVYFKKQHCLVGVSGEQIISMALVEDTNGNSVNTWDYICAGGLKLFKYMKISKLLSYLKIMEKSTAIIHQIKEPAWYVCVLAVDKKQQGKHYGSKMIKECIEPYVIKHHGKAIKLITNTKQNSVFYQKAGFVLVEKSVLHYQEQSLENWTFVKRLGQA